MGDENLSTIWMPWMSTSQDEKITKLVSGNAALDSILFVATEHNETAIYTFETSIESTIALTPDNIQDLWCQELMFWSSIEQSWIIVGLPWEYICILNLSHKCI